MCTPFKWAWFQTSISGFDKTSKNLETNLEVLNDHDSTDYPQRDYLMDDGYGWLDCVSKKSGLPRWLLGITILLSALAMIWLCCVTTATAPDQHVSPQVGNEVFFRYQNLKWQPKL